MFCLASLAGYALVYMKLSQTSCLTTVKCLGQDLSHLFLSLSKMRQGAEKDTLKKSLKIVHLIKGHKI